MKIEFPVLESEPLIYFLLHSGVFVLALACVFFILGLWMGAAIWGRYKKHLNNARMEIAGQFQEIAVLKRKLAEQTMRPSSGPLTPPAALLTEVLPAVGEIFPERAAMARQTAPTSRSMPAVVSAPPSLASDLAPAPAVSTPVTLAVPAPAAPVFAPAPVAAPIITLTPTPAPLVPVADAEAHADPVLPAPAPLPGTTASDPEPSGKRKTGSIRRPTVRVKVRKEAAAPAVPASPGAASEPEAADMAEPFLLSELPDVKPVDKPAAQVAEVKVPAEASPEDDDVTPFGFLLGDPAEPAPPSMSSLAEILKNAAEDVKSISQPAAVITPAPAPLPPPLPEIPSVLPEIDPSLGIVYKIPPQEADDLTRIKGIASVLEKRLHELGIYTWRQIASWQDSHIREFSSRLAFKDRIVREKWVEQARSLNEARHLA